MFKGNYFGNWRALAWCVDKVIGGHSLRASVHYEDTKLLVFPECVNRGSPSATGEIMCRPFIVQVSYQPQPLVYSWNLKNKIEFWMSVWNARCRRKPSRGSHTCSKLQSTKPFCYWAFVIISSFGIGTEIPWEYFQYVFFPTRP